MIEIKAVEKDDDSFDITLKAKANDRSKFTDQVIAVLNELYHIDEHVFTRALIRSDFGDMVTSLGKGELE